MAHYLGELTESNMKNLQALIDSNSVIGKEIVTTDGTVSDIPRAGYANTADRVVGMVPDVVDKVSGLISGGKKEKPAEEE